MYCSNNNKSNCWQAGSQAVRVLAMNPTTAWLGLGWLGLAVVTTSCTCFQLNNVAFIFTGCATTTTTRAANTKHDTNKRATSKGWGCISKPSSKDSHHIFSLFARALALSPFISFSVSLSIKVTASTNYLQQKQPQQTALSTVFAPFLHLAASAGTVYTYTYKYVYTHTFIYKGNKKSTEHHTKKAHTKWRNVADFTHGKHYYARVHNNKKMHSGLVSVDGDVAILLPPPPKAPKPSERTPLTASCPTPFASWCCAAAIAAVCTFL